MPDRSTNHMTNILGSLSESIRLRLMVVLGLEELSVGEVARVLGLPQSTVSRHLKRLNEAGWVSKRAVGTATLYRFDEKTLEPTMASLWTSIANGFNESPELIEDRQRLEAVLAQRPTDSQAFFGRVAGQWDAFRRELFGERFTAEALLGLVNPWWTVADLGCGTGDAAAWLGPRVERLLAVDRAEVMLDAAQTRLAGMDNIEFVQAEVEQLPLAPASIDACVCLLVLHHIEEPARVLSEMARVLRTEQGGGVALIVDMLEHSHDEYRQSMGHVHLGFSPDAMAEMMNTAGFERVEVQLLTRETQGKGPGLFAAAGWLKRAS